jgi:hypothetical protein
MLTRIVKIWLSTFTQNNPFIAIFRSHNFRLKILINVEINHHERLECVGEWIEWNNFKISGHSNDENF